ncbi:MAG TPA: hypothetical protein VHD90_10685 [Phototrophicaceae bacterium]|nr:hypothetical protein [Phototrophicaceae bacterium]
MSYRRSQTEWEWQDGAKHYAVRAFIGTRRLIWSSWVETRGAPVFDEGFAQTFEEFKRGEPLDDRRSHVAPPQTVLDALHALIASADQPKSRSLFGRLRNR